MKKFIIIALCALYTTVFAQSPVKVVKEKGKYQVTFAGNQGGKSVIWTTYGKGLYFSDLETKEINKDLKIKIEDQANFWIIGVKDTVSVWVITPVERDMELTIVVNGRILRNGNTVPREFWDYLSFKEEIDNQYSESDN